jgi:radical SAM-linked protein
MVRHRVRIRFCKQGDLRLIGHRDLLRCMERWFRRAALPLARSEGFHPKPRMSFPLALALGIEGTDEVMELELREPLGGEEIARRLAPCAPPGLGVRSVEVLAEGRKKARVRSVTYEARLDRSAGEGLAARIERLLGAAAWPVERPGGRGRVDLRADLEALAWDGRTLSMRLRADGPRRAGPRDVLAALGLEDPQHEAVRLVRTAVEIEP